MEVIRVSEKLEYKIYDITINNLTQEGVFTCYHDLDNDKVMTVLDRNGEPLHRVRIIDRIKNNTANNYHYVFKKEA
jgi:hypothetical protein